MAEQDRLTQSGCYILVINMWKKKAIRIGKLGIADFPRGTYLYSGSARNGLRARLLHHLKRAKKRKHWHIDYLLGCPQVKVTKIFLHFASRARECEMVQRLKKISGARIVAKGFGASDCVSGCGSHLIHFHNEPISLGLGKEFPLATVDEIIGFGSRYSRR